MCVRMFGSWLMRLLTTYTLSDQQGEFVMRPDEHKKKRSAQYKKKHGDTAETTKTTKQKGSATPKSEPTVKSSTSPSSASRGQKESDLPDLDESWEQNKSYRKRQVVSNWERYEGTARLSEETTTLRGADFKAIVDAGGSAFSQFRFRDEQLWEESDESASEETPECLAIDCEDLAASLLCLPLHERLNIDKSQFQEDQIASFDQQANTYKVAYEQRLHEVPTTLDPGEDSVSEDTALSTIPDTGPVDRCGELNQSEDFLDDILRASDANNFVDSSRDVETQQLSEADVNSVIDSATLSGFTRTLKNEGNIASGDCENVSDVKPLEMTENTSSSEPTLPSKLMAATETASHKHSAERKTVNQQNTVASIEDELDFLLTLEVPVSNEVKSTVNSDTGRGDSLDDWLDDMIAG